MSVPYKLKEKLDPSTWERGIWDKEPDHAEFTYRNINCCIMRMPWGVLNGYVDVSDIEFNVGVDTYDIDVNVHGGITYNHMNESDNRHWIGFDCHHAWDIAPGRKSSSYPDNSYKTFNYVLNQTLSLVDQLLEKQ